MTEKRRPKDMLGRSGLISVQQAQDIIIEQLKGFLPDTETVPLTEGLNRILATDIQAVEDLPPDDRSTMDGFAVKAEDTFGASQSAPCYLNITGEVRMGRAAEGEVALGCCHRIPTGGMLPKGANAVVMLEDTVPVDNSLVEVTKGVGTGTNLIRRGEDIAVGELALPRGHRLRPQDLGLLAGLGITQIEVFRQLRVGILATGDEIIPHSATPQPGEIRNINSIALAAQVQARGHRPVDYGIVSDQEEVFTKALNNALQECNMVLFSGGSSVGVRDLGERVIEKVGPPGILVHGVRLKPGKPILIGMSGRCPIFGLPGHPVSAMVCFDLFVSQALDLLSGETTERTNSPTITATLARSLNSAAGRRDIVRVRLKTQDDQITAEPVLGKSGSITTLSRAHGWFVIAEDSQGVSENSTIQVFLYR